MNVPAPSAASATSVSVVTGFLSLAVQIEPVLNILMASVSIVSGCFAIAWWVSKFRDAARAAHAAAAAASHAVNTATAAANAANIAAAAASAAHVVATAASNAANVVAAAQAARDGK